MSLTMWFALASIIMSMFAIGATMFNLGRTYGRAEGARDQAAVTYLINRGKFTEGQH